MASLVYGIGVNDRKYPAKVNHTILKEYDVWQSLLARCHSTITQRKYPTYVGCSVSENFKSYSYFYEWCQNQIGFYQEKPHLDKDLLSKGNKIYSKDTCLFLPRELNNLITLRRADRGNLPLGVTNYQGKFIAQCSTKRASQHIGIFNTAEEAFNAYKQVKEAFIKAQAAKWKAFIDPRAYEALMAYTILITD